MASDLQDIEWSTSTVFITEIINTNKLPVLVKVAEGYYGNSDAESFSIGDLIKLDFVKSIQKVRATVIARNGVEAEEILIPLGYKGKVVVKSSKTKDKSYHSVDDLRKNFPRFVRVAKAFKSKGTRYSEAKNIEVDEHLELDRYIDGMGLVCKNKTRNESLVISPEGEYHFISEPDTNEYTINEVIEHFPLPTTVVFVEDEIQKIFTADLEDALENMYSFCGCLRLLEIMTEEVVIGHHKPLAIPGQADNIVQRNLIMLPTTREVVKELEVFLPINTQDSTYELLLARNFSQKLNMQAIDGALYVEMAKRPMNMIPIGDGYVMSDQCNENPGPMPPTRPDTDCSDIPPLVPPRSPSPSKEMPYEDVIDGSDAPPKVPPRSDPLSKEKPYEDLIETDDTIYCTIDNNENTTETSKDDNKENANNKKGSKKKHSKNPFKSFKSTKSDKHDKDSKKEKSHPVGTDYENSDMISSVSSQDIPMAPTSNSFSFDRFRNKPLPPVPVESDYETLPIDQCARLPGMNMTVSELKENLQYCGLKALASICQKNSLDGNFLFKLSDDQLARKPYNLDSIQITKIRRMGEGWLPKK